MCGGLRLLIARFASFGVIFGFSGVLWVTEIFARTGLGIFIGLGASVGLGNGFLTSFPVGAGDTRPPAFTSAATALLVLYVK